MVRRATLLLVAPVLCLFVAPGSAVASSSTDPDVSHTEYRAITKGMTRAQVARVTHHADFKVIRLATCRVRTYDGWDRKHTYVGVAFNTRYKVASKDTTPRRGGTMSLTCSQ